MDMTSVLISTILCLYFCLQSIKAYDVSTTLPQWKYVPFKFSQKRPNDHCNYVVTINCYDEINVFYLLTIHCHGCKITRENHAIEMRSGRV